jgi:maltoporin
MLITCTVLVSLSALADDAVNQLRNEFEAYKTESEARIASLESEAENAGQLTDNPALDFEFHGYFRAGLGVNGNGDGMEAFRAPNAESKYRLGNEAETYVEATFQQNFRAPQLIEQGVDFHTVLTFAYVTPTIDNNSFDTTTSLREAYAGARGVWSAQPEAQFWAGNRFYEHLDIHIIDFFFRDMSGFGGGIEDVKIDNGMKWAAAWLGGSIDELDSSGIAYENDYNFNKNTLDLRLYNIALGSSTLALSLDISDFGGDQLVTEGTTNVVEDSFGWAAGAILTTPLGDNLSNRLTVQYGEGAADNFKAVITAPKGVDLTTVTTIPINDTRRLRITDDIVIETGSPVSLQAVAVYEYYDNGFDSMSTIDWVSLGARPIYHFNSWFSLAFEGGFDYTRQDDGPEGVLGKLTLAPQIQPGTGHFDRPSIRAYLTYAAWSDGFEGSVAPVSYGDDSQGISCGVQMEAWW